ncbi:MAG: TolC family protein [Bacteroidota bacterium]
MQNAQAQYDAAQEQLRASEESYKITNDELRLGSINLVDLLQQKNLYVQPCNRLYRRNTMLY